MKKTSEYEVFHDVVTGESIVIIRGIENYDKAKQIANRYYKVSVGRLSVRYAKVVDDDTVEYDVAKKDANAIAIVKEDK